MTNPFIRAEDAERKGFDFSPWGGLEGFLKASQAGGQGNAAVLKRLVPDLAHAVDMTATAISNLPFEIVPYEMKQPETDKEGKPADEEVEVFDSSKDWQNKLGGMPNPKRLLYLIASSLCGGKAYVIPTRTPRAIFDLQYAAPHTIQPQISMEGLQWFDRANDQGKTARLAPDELLYFWLPDSDVELGPALNHPLSNAMLDAQLVMAMKNTLKEYGDRGFVPITLLGATGGAMVNQAEREKTESFFDRLLRFGFHERAKIFNAETLTIQQVGAGMEQLKQSYLEIRRDAKESIADSFGIPPSMFMSDKAYASEMDVLMRQWYSDSRFVIIYETIEETLTEQLFKPYGYKMRFMLETIDIFQEDENAKSASLGQIVTAVTTDPAIAKWAMSVLGYEMTKEQEAEMETLVAKKEEEKAKQEQLQRDQMQQNADLTREAMTAKQPTGNNDQPPPKDEQKPPPPAKALTPDGITLTAEDYKDLSLWSAKSIHYFESNRMFMALEWENKHLPEDIAAPIRLKLANAKTIEDVTAAFTLDNQMTQTPAPVYEDSIKALAASIEKAVAKVEEK